MVISRLHNHNKVRSNHNVDFPDHNKLCERVAKHDLLSKATLAKGRRLLALIIMNPAVIIMRRAKACTKYSILVSILASHWCPILIQRQHRQRPRGPGMLGCRLVFIPLHLPLCFPLSPPSSSGLLESARCQKVL